MKAYPYIGDNGNGTIVIFNKEARGFLIRPSAYSCREKGYYYTWNEDLFKNITREYLANTYGKVESKEHAEFIVKLAGVNGFIRLMYNAQPEKARSFMFYEDNTFNIYKHEHSELHNDAKSKLITIPLPPKTLAPTATPEGEFEMQQIEKNNCKPLLASEAERLARKNVIDRATSEGRKRLEQLGGASGKVEEQKAIFDNDIEFNSSF